MGEEVFVYDADGKVLMPTYPKKARKLLEKQQARVLKREPFAIKLAYSVKSPDLIRRSAMNIREYLAQDDIYIQNRVNGNVVLDFEHDGQKANISLPASSRDPICLSDRINPEMIRHSILFTQLLNRRPPAIVLLTKQEYEDYFQKKAKATGIAESILKEEAQALVDKRTARADKITEEIPTAIPTTSGATIKRMVINGELVNVGSDAPVEEVLTENEIINPRVLQICMQAKKPTEGENRDQLSAKDTLDQLVQLASELKHDDYEHIRATVPHKIVRTWAEKMEIELNKNTQG